MILQVSDVVCSPSSVSVTLDHGLIMLSVGVGRIGCAGVTVVKKWLEEKIPCEIIETLRISAVGVWRKKLISRYLLCNMQMESTQLNGGDEHWTRKDPIRAAEIAIKNLDKVNKKETVDEEADL